MTVGAQEYSYYVFDFVKDPIYDEVLPLLMPSYLEFGISHFFLWPVNFTNITAGHLLLRNETVSKFILCLTP